MGGNGNYSMNSNIKDDGYKQGMKSKQHPVQEIQEEWDKKFHKDGMSYDEFNLWLEGYKESRKLQNY